MNDETKIEAIESLQKFGRDRSESRSRNEWKLCFALWTVLLACIVSFLTHRFSVSGSARWIAPVVAVIVILVHYWRLSIVERKQHLEGRIFYFYRKKIMEIIGVEFDQKIEAEIKKVEELKQPPNHILKLTITILLAGLACIAVFLRFPRVHPTEIIGA